MCCVVCCPFSNRLRNPLYRNVTRYFTYQSRLKQMLNIANAKKGRREKKARRGEARKGEVGQARINCN